MLADDDPPEPATLLARIEAAYHGHYTTTGDPVVDRWDEMLERGEVPEEFWGPDGPPVKP